MSNTMYLLTESEDRTGKYLARCYDVKFISNIKTIYTIKYLKLSIDKTM